jgi:hypothetical protein
MDPMTKALLELHAEIGDRTPIVLAGGFGLYLKQQRLLKTEGQTLFSRELWPVSRTTEDIDLLLYAEIATSSQRMGEIRQALDRLGFKPIETAKYYQFVRSGDSGTVKIDLLAGPLGEHESRVKADDRRVRPKPSVNLHARRTPEAIGVEEESITITLEGSDSVEVRLPNALTFALMKLGALHDRAHDEEKNLGRHHALDLYRCVAMLTPSEDEAATRIRKRHANHESLSAGREHVQALFRHVDGVGRLRLQEHPLLPVTASIDRFIDELEYLVVGHE